MKLRNLEPGDRARIRALLSGVDAFTDDERDVALELVDVTLAHPESDDYRFLLAFPEGGSDAELLGYLCYGRTPMTRSTYDLYWVATAPEHARKGVAKNLVHAMEGEIARDGGGLVRVETGSREGHGAAVRFYDALGFARSALLEDFYAPGDDLLIFTRRVAGAGAEDAAAPAQEEALIDAAFGYRDYAAERDFFLACARRFGGRDVRRVLAWECGPGRHLAAFADAGIAAIGIDGSEKMVACARGILGPSLTPRTSVPAGPRALTSPTPPRDTKPSPPRDPRQSPPLIELACSSLASRPDIAPVDLSFVPLSAIHQLASPDAMVAHLQHAAAVLAPSGLHIIEATHPSDLTPSGVHHTEWTEVRADAVVHARFRMHIERALGRAVPVTLEVVSEPKRGGTASALPSLRRSDLWFVPTLDDYRAMLARVPELSLVATIGDFNPDVPFEHPAAWRLLLVLRRA